MSFAKFIAVAAIAFLFGIDTCASQNPPARKDRLLKWLQAGTYRSSFIPEPAPRESFTAHGEFVRTWYSPILAKDLKQGRLPFRKNAAMVKELFGSTVGEVRGWSVMRKIDRKSGRRGAGWLFYERFPNGGTFFGRGLGTCTVCHRGSTDYLLSTFRP